MKVIKIGSMLIAATVLSVFASGAAFAENLKIGVIGPLTGPGAPWGTASKVAAEIIADEVNADGGLDVGGTKYKIEIIAYDDQYKAAEAVAAYNRLINEDEVKYVMIVTSASTMAVKQNVEDDQVVAITSAFAPDAIDENTKYMVRIYSVTGDYLPAYVKWMKENLPERRVVHLNPNDETGWGQQKVADPVFEAAGFENVASELYERNVQDFAPLLTKVIALDPEIIDTGVSSPTTAALIVRQARELGFKGRFIQTTGAAWKQIVDAAGTEGAEGLVNMLYADPANEGYQNLVKKYEAKVGQEPNNIIVSYYDGYKVLLETIKTAGTVDDTAKVAASYADALPVKSVQGDELTWGNQQIKTYQYISVLKDGKPNVIGKIK